MTFMICLLVVQMRISLLMFHVLHVLAERSVGVLMAGWTVSALS